MDHQWRSRPPIPGTICPTCSFSHFPFCPPHPNPGFPSEQQLDHFIPRPGFDLYGPPAGPHLRPWLRNPNFDEVAYVQPQFQPHIRGNGFLGESDRNKRMRFDDNSAMGFSEDERRLKLIRDHGGMLSGPSQPQESPCFEGKFQDRNGFQPVVGLNQFGHSQNEEFPHSQYGHVAAPMHPFPNNVNQQSHMLSHEAPHQHFHSHNSLQFQPKNSHFAPHHEQGSSTSTDNNHLGHGFHFNHPRDLRQSSQDGHPSLPGPGIAQYGSPNLDDRGSYLSHPTRGHMDAFRAFNGQPPPLASPPPPLPAAPPMHPKPSSTLFPVPVSSSPLSYPPRVTESHSVAQPYFNNKPPIHVSTGFEVSQASRMLPKLSPEKPKVIASHLFKQPHRATRPDHFVIILRGLPGSGKSYLAKMLRDLEVENGGDAPRIHSMDDYFMTEVEKVEESDVSKSSSSARGKKRTMKKVMEYCYEPEMEEAYRSSMLKAFKKTLEEGVFTFVIVDDRNLRVADFAQFWAIAKRSGYEVYVLEATYKDPAGCAARNVHGFTQDDIEKMAGQWEEAPSLYLQLDMKSLFHGDDLKESEIQEVDMDMEDGDSDESLSRVEQRKPEQIDIAPTEANVAPEDLNSSKDRKRIDAEGDHPTEKMKEPVRSKWSDDFDEEKTEKSESVKGNTSSLSGLIQAYSKQGKSVHWGDQVHNTGFSIGAAKKNAVSIEIGPGAGYNLKSNPLPEDSPIGVHGTGGSRRQNVFQEQLRAERESFKAVFDRRRQRIGGLGLHLEEE